MNYLRLIGCIALCQAAGIVGGIFTAQSVRTWYVTLQKPSFAPPNWVFGPAWITLYTLMGIALYLVWQKTDEANVPRAVFIVFGIQLLLNALWSYFFFGLRSPLLGFIEITLLWAAIVATIILLWRISSAAALLLTPYLLWVTFAAALNFSLWRMNTP
jgi:tryptophan-rich sensory protein